MRLAAAARRKGVVNALRTHMAVRCCHLFKLAVTACRVTNHGDGNDTVAYIYSLQNYKPLHQQ